MEQNIIKENQRFKITPQGGGSPPKPLYKYTVIIFVKSVDNKLNMLKIISMKNKKQDSKMTKAELEKAIRQLEKIRNNQAVWNTFNKHMKGALVYRLGKFRRLLREK